MKPQSNSWLGWLAVLFGGAVALFAGLHKGPTPGPNPSPLPQGSFVLFVVDNDNRTPEQAAVIDSDDLWAWLTAQKVGRLSIGKAQKAYADWGLDKVLADNKVSVPCAVLYDAQGAVVRAAALPASVDKVKEFVAGKALFDEPPSIVVDGEKRFLTCLPPAQAKFMSPRGGEFRDAVSAPIPQSQWREVSNRAKFPASDWIYDQDGIGSCVGNGSTNALRKARFLAGMTDVRLAPGCTYAQINGGRDQGAVISDSLTALQQTGTISSKTLGSDEKPFMLRQMPKGWQTEAAQYRIEEAYHCSSFEDMATAIQLGFVVVYGVQVGNNFNNFDSDGCPGYSRGPGNHCMHADGLKKLPSGQWGLDNANSWGAWGPQKDGRCYLTAKFFAPPDQPDAYAVKTAVVGPKPPPLKKAELEVVPVGKGQCGCGANCCGCGQDCKCAKKDRECCPACPCADQKTAKAADCYCGGSPSNPRCICPEGKCRCAFSPPATPPPGVKPKAREPVRPPWGECSNACTCGCRQGGDCRCGQGMVPNTTGGGVMRDVPPLSWRNWYDQPLYAPARGCSGGG